MGHQGRSGSRRLAGRRPTKFTKEAVKQIRELVESGKSREEIAALIGVTVGTLQVTCSKLGISLRRSRVDHASGVPLKQLEVQTLNQVRAGAAKFVISIRHKGKERILTLPLTDDVIRQLALEAEFRNMSIGEFLVDLITAITKKGRIGQVLESKSNPTRRAS